MPPLEPGGPALAAWYAPARETGAGAVLFLHGYRGRRTELAALAADLARRSPCALLLPDLRGSGANPRGATTAGPGEAEDALACLRFLAAEGFEPGRVALAGSSMGAVAAILAAGDERLDGPLAGLLLVSPYESLARSLDRRFRHWTGLGTWPVFSLTVWFGERFAGRSVGDGDVVAAAGAVRARHGWVLGVTDDWRTPIEAVAAVARALDLPLERVPGRGHHVFATAGGARIRDRCAQALARWVAAP